VVAATGVRSRGLPVRALISCAALLAAAALAPAALASGLVPDPDPGPDPAQPQPDAYQTAPAATAATAPATPAPTETVAQTPAPVLPTVHISTPRTQPPSAPAKAPVHPVVVATPTHVSEAASEPPATESTTAPSGTHIVVPAPVHTQPSTKARPPRPAHVGRVPRQAAHHARATAPQVPTISFARSVIHLRWWHAVPAPAVEVVRPRHVSPGVALAVAAVVLLSGSFLVVAARQVRQA